MLEGSSDNHEQYKEPEEPDNLNIPPAELIDGDKSYQASGDCPNRYYYQTLPGIVDQERIHSDWWRIVGAVPNIRDDFRAVHSKSVKRSATY